jgi:tetratricopeptide (TPR) repeat protein
MAEQLTPNRALQYSFELRRSEKYFAAQKVLERALETAEECTGAPRESPLLALIGELGALTEDYQSVKKAYSVDFYYILGSLADLHLLQGHTLDSLAFAEAAVKTLSDGSALSRKFEVSVVYHAVFVSGLRIMYSLLGEKKLGLMARSLKVLDKLAEWVDEAEERSERELLGVGYYHLLNYSWFGDDDRLSKAAGLLGQVQALEVRIVLTYYTQPDRALSAAYELVADNPSSSMNWTWLGILEQDSQRAYNAFRQAIALDPKNYVAWTSLSVAQVNDDKFVEAAKSWVVSHKFNHSNPALWLLSSFLNKLLQQSTAVEHFKLAVNLDPTFVFVQLKEEFEALG